ncbi:hypothetical protein ES703_120624 [subsurface metagenome]
MKKSKKIFKAKLGARFKKSRIQAYGEEIERIKTKHKAKMLKSQIIVDEAREENSPIHECFQWDDSKASELYRRHQAVNLINHIVIIDVKDGEEKEVPFLVNVKIADSDEEDRGYISFEELIDDELLYTQYLNGLIQELITLKAKIKNFKELKGIYREIDKVQKNLISKEARI